MLKSALSFLNNISHQTLGAILKFGMLTDYQKGPFLLMKTLVWFIFIWLTPFLRADLLKLPSRDATIVMPLLESFNSNKTYNDVIFILGKADIDIGGGSSKHSSFLLAGGKSIRVETREPDPPKADFIVREIPLHSPDNKEIRIIYKEP